MITDKEVIRRLFVHHDIMAATKGAARREPGETDVLWPGWDYYPSPHSRGPADQGVSHGHSLWGMARLPHLGALGQAPAPAGHRLTFTQAPMSVLDLYAAFWNLLCVNPLAGIAIKTSEDKLDGYKDNLADKAVQTILGVKVRHVVNHLGNLERGVPTEAAKLKAKLYRDVVRSGPVEALWATGTDKEVFLPCLQGHAGIAEISRVAQNFGAMLRLSFNARGEPYNVADLLNRRLAKRYADDSADRLRRSASLQSEYWDGVLGSAAVKMAARLKFLASSANLTLPPVSLDDIASHPRNTPIIRGGNAATPPIPAVSLQGLDYWSYAIEGLGQLYFDAREITHRTNWKNQFPGQDTGIAKMTFGKAAARLIFEWTLFHHPSALPHVFKKLSVAKTPGTVTWAAIEELLLNDHTGAKLKARADELCDKAPDPGERGYSARHRFHLWLDDEGDDLPLFREFRQQSEPEISKILLAIEADQARADEQQMAIEKRRVDGTGKGGGARLKEVHSSKIAPEEDLEAKSARDAAMMVTGPATDPMLDIIRKHKKLLRFSGATKQCNH